MRQCVIEEETEELDEKPLRHPPSGNRSTRQSVGIHGFLNFLSFYSNKASRNHVLSSSPDPTTSSMLHPPFLKSSNASQQHQKHSQHFECVWVVFGQKSSLNRYNNGRGNEKRLQDFSLRMSSSLSNEVGVLQKPLLGFSL